MDAEPGIIVGFGTKLTYMVQIVYNELCEMIVLNWAIPTGD
jgi:hypothetical protein